MNKEYKFCICSHCSANRFNSAMLMLQLQGVGYTPATLFHMIAIMLATMKLDMKIQPEHWEKSTIEIMAFFNTMVDQEFDDMLKKYERRFGKSKEDIDNDLAEVERKIDDGFDFVEFLNGDRKK